MDNPSYLVASLLFGLVILLFAILSIFIEGIIQRHSCESPTVNEN
jgi:hypothetical protein